MRSPLAVNVLAKLVPLAHEGTIERATYAYLGGPLADDEALFETCAACMSVVAGPRAAKTPVVDRLHREWSDAEIQEAINILEWATHATARRLT